MTLEHLVFTLFKGNLNKYRVFVGCNILTIGILFSLRLLLDNPYLSDPSIVDPLISSNVFAPTFFMHLFAAFFIPFTMVLLNKQIQRNYGILMSMGLERGQLYLCVLIENLLIIAISLGSGIMVGNLFAWSLLFIMRTWIGIDGIRYAPVLISHIQTIACLFIVYGATLGGIVFQMKKKNIMKIMIEEREAEERKGNKVVFFFGCTLFVLSFFVSLLLYEQTAGNILLAGIFVSYIALVLMLYNSAFILKKWRDKYLFLISDYVYYFKRNTVICAMLVGLYGIIVFVTIISATMGSSVKKNVNQYNQYDLVYSQYANAEEIDIAREVEKCGTNINYQSQVPFFYTLSHAVFGAEDVNQETGSNFDIPEGTFLYVRSNDLNDGYEHEAGYVPKQIEIEKNIYSLYYDTDRVLFCRGGGLTDTLIVLNQDDYEAVIKANPEKQQILSLLRLDDVTQTSGLKEQLEQKLGRDVSSYYDDYLRAEKSAQLLYLLMGYIAIVVLMGVCIVFHYKLSVEYDKDRHKYQLLTSMGAETTEIKKCMNDKIASVVLWPLHLTFIWMLLVNFVNRSSSYHLGSPLLKCVIIFSFLYAIMIMICRVYLRKTYIRKDQF